MGKIVAVHPLDTKFADQIKQAAPGWELIDASDRKTVDKHLPEAEIILGWNSNVAEFVKSGPSRLKWVQNWGAGVERLPLDKFREFGIMLTNASGVHPYPISETIFAMLLAFTRHLHTAIRNQARSSWEHSGDMGEIHGRTMGILGAGAIGLETARLAQAFNMKVLGVRRSGLEEKNVDEMHGIEGLQEVLQQSDFVINCMPHTPETELMLGKDQFAAMKKTAYYINIGRGKTTDTAALLEALQNGTIAGAGLDVFEQEPLPEDHPFWKMDNVIITPHHAGSTIYYTERVIAIFVDNLKQYAQGSSPESSVVDLDSEY
ncbi:D-2-hydroxyacid dehydrogenase [Paenibacillus nasutitermitis]|uniref:3-phosphoglycerate dehydrogenase n=1 Tax=Paenibacillus nasutitermitis TaxID=1652958 RepID=A0A917DUJ3_9BACL|nr:D-2-hydroxyacid dehydrogenase [Paenibacillus nasutitermitis]GGD71736.1 3-phosphoglycerate dehydrogenase [Paenibacillus nasutitermitis]